MMFKRTEIRYFNQSGLANTTTEDVVVGSLERLIGIVEVSFSFPTTSLSDHHHAFSLQVVCTKRFRRGTIMSLAAGLARHAVRIRSLRGGCGLYHVVACGTFSGLGRMCHGCRSGTHRRLPERSDDSSDCDERPELRSGCGGCELRGQDRLLCSVTPLVICNSADTHGTPRTASYTTTWGANSVQRGSGDPGAAT